MPRFEDTFRCTVEEFWTLFLTEEFQRRLHLEGLGCSSYLVLERKPESWRVHVVPHDLPGAVRKVLGDGGYIEEGQRDGDLWRFEITPDTLGDRIHISGVVRLEERDGGAVRQAEITVTASLQDGEVVRKALETRLFRQQERATTFTHEVVAEAMLSGEVLG